MALRLSSGALHARIDLTSGVNLFTLSSTSTWRPSPSWPSVRGDYRRLPVEGTHAERLCAYVRTHAGRSVIALAPRLLAGLVPREEKAADPFADGGRASTFAAVPELELQGLLSGATLHAESSKGRRILCTADVVRSFPAGLLSSEGPSRD
jgi:maltooligosyltrehalose synthase